MEVVGAFTPSAQAIGEAARCGDRLYKLPSCVSAVDVVFQVRDRSLLAGNDVLDEVPDGDHTHYMIAFEHGQMPNVFVGHQAQTFLHRFARMRNGDIG